MKGFFQLHNVTQVDPKRPQSCASCGLYKGCLTPRMKPSGENRKGVMFIGEASGEIEDRKGKQWQGRVGQFLQRTLKLMGFHLFQDGVCINSCSCRPPENETPTPQQIYCCRPRVLSAIQQFKPKVIFLLGGTAVQSIIGQSWKKDLGGINKWRGWAIPDQTLGAWLCPIFHPSYVLRNEEESYKNLENLSETLWKQDIQRVLKLAKEAPQVEQTDYSQYIHYLYKDKEVKNICRDFKRFPLLSIDYETTGLKPHREGHRIVTTAISTGPEEVFCWENTPLRDKMLKGVLKSKAPKTAHNIAFEELWGRGILGTQTNNWDWCSMNTAHCLDNRPGVTSLKFQTYINFGVPDYDSHISPFLSSSEDMGANSFNKIHEIVDQYGIEELLKYNALDALFGFKLTELQKEVLRKSPGGEEKWG